MWCPGWDVRTEKVHWEETNEIQIKDGCQLITTY